MELHVLKLSKGAIVNELKAQFIEFPELGDERGSLVVVEGNKDIPFDIKRVFYIYGSDTDIIRGCHANRKSEFVLINVCGTSKVKMRYKNHEEIFVLNQPHTGVYIPKMLWKDMYDFSEDSILLCLSSESYDDSEYIRDYDEYIRELDTDE